MIVHNNVYAFVVVEFLMSNNFLGTEIGTKHVAYSNGNVKLDFNRTEFSLSYVKVTQILNNAGVSYYEFKEFCEYFLKSNDFKIAMKGSLINKK